MFEYRTCGLSENVSFQARMTSKSSNNQEELERATGFVGEHPLVGAVETVKFEESEGSFMQKCWWEYRVEGQLERLGSHCLEMRLAAVGASELLEGEWAEAGWRDVHAGALGRLSHSMFGENVLSKVSFLAALLHLPLFSDSGLVVRAHTVEAWCSGPRCSFHPSDRPGPALVILGSA